MNFPFFKRSFILCFCIIFCFVTSVIQVCAQSQPQQPVVLALKACSGELRVFDDGTLIESRRGKTTQRRLSESQMRKLRELIERRPCIKEWQMPTSFTSVPTTVESKLSTGHINFECIMEWVSYGGGLDEIQVTIRSLDGQTGPFPVYVVCDGAKESYKKSAKRNYGRLLKPAWQRFIADISRAVGSKSFLKGCDCWQI